MRRRISRPTAINTLERRNGTRQPHAENNSANRPGREPSRERKQGQYLTLERTVIGKEDVLEERDSNRAVEEKIVPFDGRAHRAGDHRLDQGPRFAERTRLRLWLLGH